MNGKVLRFYYSALLLCGKIYDELVNVKILNAAIG